MENFQANFVAVSVDDLVAVVVDVVVVDDVVVVVAGLLRLFDEPGSFSSDQSSTSKAGRIE